MQATPVGFEVGLFACERHGKRGSSLVGEGRLGWRDQGKVVRWRDRHAGRFWQHFWWAEVVRVNGLFGGWGNAEAEVQALRQQLTKVAGAMTRMPVENVPEDSSLQPVCISTTPWQLCRDGRCSVVSFRIVLPWGCAME